MSWAPRPTGSFAPRAEMPLAKAEVNGYIEPGEVTIYKAKSFALRSRQCSSIGSAITTL